MRNYFSSVWVHLPTFGGTYSLSARAIVFFGKYIYSTNIPGAICEDAYERGLKAAAQTYNDYLDLKRPAVLLQEE
ncbi:MAG: hypothetical protein DRN55_09230 [Thermoplasmata archaeon]|nr:MAG: hypothetical protein DRN55_09230 [Thermoplasmata archaeon]